ncbi:hypothetical protein ACFC4S_18775 [Priestia megaterium]|uniref:hypothetical protein n=1 Tax=Priestia megaterium TaxID=1404 RepID=UPI0035DD0E44
MQRETARGRTREEALSNLDKLMMSKHPDAIFSRDSAQVYEYGNEKSEDKFVSECTF